MKKINKVFKIGISKKKGEKISETNEIEVLSGKGIIGDRSFHENNDLRKQLTLIESENIDYYNRKYNTNFSYVDFRRNIITKNIELNDLVGKILEIMGKPDYPVIHGPPRPGDVRRHMAGISTAENLIRFSRKVELEEGLHETISWYMSGNSG